MAEPLKNMYSESFVEGFTDVVLQIYPSFRKDAYLKQVFTEEWPQLELKERMRKLSTVLRLEFPKDLNAALALIVDVIHHLHGDEEENMFFEYMFLPDFVEQYGLDNFDAAVKAMEAITQFTSCEFAVRPFLLRYPEQMINQMLVWSRHDHAMVRRLASEGSRPRLPWGLGVPSLKKDPSPTLSILENLKTDSSETVRRSVANHLNDISKDHPELVMDIAERWKGISTDTDRLVRHACRGLLKQSHPRALVLFGLGHADKVEIDSFKLHTPTVQIGAYLEFEFDLQHTHQEALTIRLEYAIYYLKANGTHSRKVFKVSEKDYTAGSPHRIQRRQPFKLITTRVFYPGEHQISIIANGREFAQHNFTLKAE